MGGAAGEEEGGTTRARHPVVRTMAGNLEAHGVEGVVAAGKTDVSGRMEELLRMEIQRSAGTDSNDGVGGNRRRKSWGDCRSLMQTTRPQT